MDSHIQISIGLCTALGGYKDACAAFRAGLTRFNAHVSLQHSPTGDTEPDPLTVASAPDYLFGYQGRGRIVKLLQEAYEDLEGNLGKSIAGADTALFIALPNPDARCSDEPPPFAKREAFFTELPRCRDCALIWGH